MERTQNASEAKSSGDDLQSLDLPWGRLFLGCTRGSFLIPRFQVRHDGPGASSCHNSSLIVVGATGPLAGQFCSVILKVVPESPA